MACTVWPRNLLGHAVKGLNRWVFRAALNGEGVFRVALNAVGD